MELKDYTSEELIEELSSRDLLNELDEEKKAFLKEKRVQQISQFQFCTYGRAEQRLYSLKYLKSTPVTQLR